MKINILVVDDNRDTLRTYVKALLRGIKPKKEATVPETLAKGFLGIEEADTISLAFEKLRAQHFDVLVVDLKIPGLTGQEMGGLELISESIRLDPLCPIVAITGFGSVELVKKTLTQGVFDFIEKSLTAE